ncbi:MAG: hypothetical protein ACJ04Q_06800 [Flavobacteriales bacterium]
MNTQNLLSEELQSKLTDEEIQLFDNLQIFNYSEIIENPFTNEQVELVPEAVALYDFIIGAEMAANLTPIPSFSIELGIKSSFAKTMFYKLWPKEYMKLLD